MSSSQNQKNLVNDAIVKDIIETVNNLKYGQIQITVHNSRIVQIEKTEKTRFDDIWFDGSTSLTINPERSRRTEKGGGI